MNESIGRAGIMIVCGVVAAGCAGPSEWQARGPLVLLTREGCANTEILRTRTESALASWQSPPEFTVVDLGTLPESDVRRGYPTPTLLYANRDVFGLPEPRPPLPEPT